MEADTEICPKLAWDSQGTLAGASQVRISHLLTSIQPMDIKKTNWYFPKILKSALSTSLSSFMELISFPSMKERPLRRGKRIACIRPTVRSAAVIGWHAPSPRRSSALGGEGVLITATGHVTRSSAFGGERVLITATGHVTRSSALGGEGVSPCYHF